MWGDVLNSGPVFTTMRINQNGPLFLDAHISRLRESYRTVFNKTLDTNPNRVKHLIDRLEQPPETPFLARVEVHRDGRIVVLPRRMTTAPSSIRLSTQPLPSRYGNGPRIKQGSWTDYFNARRAAVSKGADAALLIHRDLIVDGDTFTPLFSLENGELAIPNSNMGAVKSVTLNETLNLISRKISVVQKPIKISQMNQIKDALAFGTGVGIRRIKSIDSHQINYQIDSPLEDLFCEIEDSGILEGHLLDI